MATSKTTSNLKSKAVVKRLISVLPERARAIIIARYGLGDSSKRETLEEIGKRYKITRERVRQIENYVFAAIRKSDAYGKEKPAFTELHNMVKAEGGVVGEAVFLSHTAPDESTKNHIHFLLVLGDEFKKRKEDEEFGHRWYVDEKLVSQVESSLKKLFENLSDQDLVPESEIVQNFFTELKDVSEEYKNEEVAKRWLSLSKKIGRNPLGEWGVSLSSNIRAKGMRDFAYLAIRRHGSPMHFREVAKAIEKLFNRSAHVATCHNELIKDPRFVLVGRGLYALKEWGYTSGVVKDVIKEILRKHGPLSKEEIVEKLLKERYVKENTIAVNLQNKKFFKKSKEGKYAVVD
ncbi:MAG: sigma factor-like helix-turn-helix DNA-binding protein [Patescibacteria group bacterium]